MPVLVLLALLALPSREVRPFLSGGEPAPTQALTFERYLELIRRYQKGDFTSTVEELVPATSNFIERASLELNRRTSRPVDPMTASAETLLEADALLKAAVLLHTQAAVLKEGQGDRVLRDCHIEAAHAMAARLADWEFRRQWLVAIGYYYQSRLEEGRAVSAFEAILSETPRDTEALLGLGTVHEAVGSLRNRPQPDFAPMSPSGGAEQRAMRQHLRLRTDSRQKLERAEGFYRRALAGDPDLAEAHLRLGRVLGLLGRYTESSHELDWVIANASDGDLISMAHLFAGRLCEEQGRAEEAIRHYQTAMEMRPGWQVLYLALSHAHQNRGDQEASADIARRGLRLPSETRQAQGGRWAYHLKLRAFIEAVLQLRKGALE